MLMAIQTPYKVNVKGASYSIMTFGKHIKGKYYNFSVSTFISTLAQCL